MRGKNEQKHGYSEKEVDFTDVVELKLQTLLKEGASTFMDFEWLEPKLPSFFDEKKISSWSADVL